MSTPPPTDCSDVLRRGGGELDSIDPNDRESLLRSLERSETRYRLAALATNEAIWDWDVRSGRLTVHSLFGHPRDAATDMESWLDLVHPEDRERVRASLSEALDTRPQPWQQEYRFRAADGGWLDVVDRGYVVHDTCGQAERMVGAMQDVTARRRQQEFERQLIGIVSHDLKEPLHTIALAAAMLERSGDVGEPAKRNVARIQAAVDRATRMVRDLLDFTRARLGAGVTLERRHVDLAPVFDALVTEARLGHPGRAIGFDVSGDARGEFDADRLAQVLTNLLDNALKYSPPGSPVHVAVGGAEDEVTLTVQNAGPPISPERLPLMFKPLQRCPTSFDDASRSVGLGLYIVKHLVEAHGGRVEVRSAEVTEFIVRLPRSAQPSPPPATAMPPSR